ncbi:MAG TPA: hypothetical protein DDY98_09120 [Ruminococcaceae bacterium]|nr:hypothetical protein [Oscillospiraceae bacterium]
MKTVRRILAIFLCLVLGAASLVVVSNADDAVNGSVDKKFPIIIVPGYSSASMYEVTEDNPQKPIWRIGVDDVLPRIFNNSFDLSVELLRWAAGNPKAVADIVGREFVDMCGDMAYDQNGKPIAELHVYHSSAAEVNTAYLNEYEDGQYIHEWEIMPYVTQDLGDMAEEWTFNFNTDFRQNIIFCAMDLAKLVKDVKQYTGQEQVNLIAVSHGGQITATYLSLCAIASRGGKQAQELAEHLGISYKELTELFTAKDVHNAVMTVPAIGGALLAYDIMTNQITFDEETLLYFVENGMMFETDFNWLFKAQQLGFLDELLYYFQPYIMQILGCWGSIWDFVPLDTYETVKKTVASKQFLQSDVIKQSDYFHSKIMSNMAQNLQTAENLGVNVYIIAGSGSPSVVGSQETSDAIISVNASTGATVAPLGRRFSNGYQTKNTQCNDPNHNHLSPAMDIDLSTGYLPETTWVVNRLFHGMTLKDDYTATLMKMLIESDERITVHDKKEYPQFHDSMNTCESVYAEFATSNTGFVSSQDKALRVMNLSKNSKMIVLSVTTDNPNLKFSAKNCVGKIISSWDSIVIPFDGTVQEKSLETTHITVSYMLIGSVTPINEKTFTFTLANGKADTYDPEKPYTDAGVKASQNSTAFSRTFLGRLLAKTNFGAVLSLFYRIFASFTTLAFSRS